MSDYKEVIEVIRRGKVPLPVVFMHLKHGVKDDEVCGHCDHRAALMIADSEGRPGYRYFCSLSFSSTTLPATVVACKKFRPRASHGYESFGFDPE